MDDVIQQCIPMEREFKSISIEGTIETNIHNCDSDKIIALTDFFCCCADKYNIIIKHLQLDPDILNIDDVTIS